MTTRACAVCIAVAALGIGAGTAWSQEDDPEVARLKAEVEAKRKDLKDAEERLARAIQDRPARRVDEMPPLPSRVAPGPAPAPDAAGVQADAPASLVPSSQAPGRLELPPPPDDDRGPLDDLPPVPTGRNPFELDRPPAAPRDPQARRAASSTPGRVRGTPALPSRDPSPLTLDEPPPAARLSALERKMDRVLESIDVLRRDLQDLKARR